MANAYTPGLTVTSNVEHRVRRVLPIPGDVLVKVGQQVDAQDVVAQTHLPGDITPVNMANLLSMPPADVRECMLKKEGEHVEVGEPLARTRGIFGFFKNTLTAKTAGTIETISSTTGQVIIRGPSVPVQVLAYLSGTVEEVIPGSGVVIRSLVTHVQGIFGIGGEAYGPIRVACKSHEEELTADLITPAMKGAVVLGGARMSVEAIRRAIQVGAAAVISGGIDDQDLRDVLGYDLGVAITGSEKLGTTLIITEGFGEIAMAQRTFMLLASHQGDLASVNGSTQIRAGVMRPEVVVPLHTAQREAVGGARKAGLAVAGPKYEAGQLVIGRPVRIIRDPYFGVIGTVAGLPPEPTVLGSGSKARVLEVRMESGESVAIPRANVELIEG
jgi:hypothetical protein